MTKDSIVSALSASAHPLSSRTLRVRCNMTRRGVRVVLRDLLREGVIRRVQGFEVGSGKERVGVWSLAESQ